MDIAERIEVLDEIDTLLSSTKIALQRDENINENIDEALYNLNLIVQLMTSMVRSNERNN